MWLGVSSRAGINLSYNYVGLDISFNLDKGNGSDGILLDNITDSNIENNYASGNGGHGFNIIDSDDLYFNANKAGVNGATNIAIPNSGDGLNIDNGQDVFISNGIFSGNLGDGVEIDSSTAITMVFSIMGLSANHEIEVGNSLQGLYIRGGSSQIAIGLEGFSGNPNWFSANIQNGIRADSSSFIDIQDNNIGNNGLGTDSGNGLHGIWIVSSTDMNVLNNGIFYSGQDGIQVLGAALRNRFRYNNISENGDLGIDLNGDGVTTNDVDDVDGGANGTQNFPVMSTVSVIPGGTGIRGSFNSGYGGGDPYTFDFYSSASCDASNYGEGASFIGSFVHPGRTSLAFYGEVGPHFSRSICDCHCD